MKKFKGMRESLKGNKEVSNSVAQEESDTHKTKDGSTSKKGLWYNINQKKKRGETPAKKGDPDRPSNQDFVDARKTTKEATELDEAIDFRKAFMDIQSYAKKSGGIDKTDFEKVAYYVKAIGDNQNTPNVANKAFMAMKKFVGDMDTDPRDGVMLMLKKHGMMKNGRLVQESITEGALGKQWVNGAKRVKSGSITLVKAKFAYDLHTVMKNGKKVGTFVFDDGPDAFSVTNMSTKKVSWADQIDDIPKMFESVELDEAIDFFKVSKELSDYAKKNGGPDKREFEKAAAYVREIGKNSAVSVQDKAGKGLNMLFKNADTDVRDRMQMILTKGGFKVKGGYVMRESTAAYGKSLSDIRNKRKMAAIKPKDRETLKKLSDLMKKANEDSVEEGKWFVRQSAKPNKTGTYQGKKYDDGKKAIAQARKDWKLTPDEHMSAKMMKEAIEEGLDARQIALLKKNYSTIDRIDPSGPAYKKAVGMISGLDKDMQMDLAKAKIKFLSQIAADQLRKQHKIKLKAKDYMESLTFSELVNNG